ncbi:MAG: hypothetical protein IKS10_09955 [Lachnospiraceae bacterium]|nr:hypothetical protein [Lachnospiraceae bacterium]
MAVMNCKMCGNPLFVMDGMTTRECTTCKTVQTVPKNISNENLDMINRATAFRQSGDYDKATKIYKDLVAREQDADLFWGLVLCRYGVHYVDDASSGRKIPACDNPQYQSVLADDNYLRACELATPEQYELFSEEARIIAAIQKRHLQEVNAKEAAESRMLSDGSDRFPGEEPGDGASGDEASVSLLPAVLGRQKLVDPEMAEADRIFARGILDTRSLNNLANRYEKLAAVRAKPGDSKEVRAALEERRVECLEKAKECRYRSANMILEANGNAESMMNASNTFAQLEYYKDSKDLMLNCMDRALDKTRKVQDRLASASVSDRRLLADLSMRYKELTDEEIPMSVPDEIRKSLNSRKREFTIRANECDYLIALIDMENSKDPEILRTAAETFQNLGKFRDASKRMDEAQKKSMAAMYERAEQAMKWAYEPEQFEEAAALFEELGDYRDSVLQASVCRKKAVRKELKHISNKRWHLIVAAVAITVILIVALLVWIQPELPVWVGVFLGVGYLWKRILETL